MESTKCLFCGRYAWTHKADRKLATVFNCKDNCGVYQISEEAHDDIDSGKVSDEVRAWYAENLPKRENKNEAVQICRINLENVRLGQGEKWKR